MSSTVLAYIPSPSQGVWFLGPIPIRAYALCIIAGIVVGPYSPGFEADVQLALQLSEIGVILLMFGVGLKISIDDIWAMRLSSVPSSVLQTLLVAVVGAGAGVMLGMPVMEASILGLALSVASTIVSEAIVVEPSSRCTFPASSAATFVLVRMFTPRPRRILAAYSAIPSSNSGMILGPASISSKRISSLRMCR